MKKLLLVGLLFFLGSNVRADSIDVTSYRDFRTVKQYPEITGVNILNNIFLSEFLNFDDRNKISFTGNKKSSFSDAIGDDINKHYINFVFSGDKGFVITYPIKMNISYLNLRYESGEVDGRVLDICKGATVTLKNVLIQDNNNPMTRGSAIYNAGVLNASDIVFLNDAIDIRNDGTVNFTGGKIDVLTGITGNGTLNVKGSKVVFDNDAILYQNKINITKGYVAVSAKKLQAQVVNNANKGLVLADGTLKNTDVSGKGSVAIQGHVVLDETATISQKIFNQCIVYDSSDGMYETVEVIRYEPQKDENGNVVVKYYLLENKNEQGEYEKVYYTKEEIVQSGRSIKEFLQETQYEKVVETSEQLVVGTPKTSLTANADSIKGVVDNDAGLYLTGGTITKAISGDGNVIIRGDVENKAKVSQELVIEEGNNFTTSASLLKMEEVINSGNLVLTEGLLKADIVGSGIIIIDGVVTNTAALVNKTIVQKDSVLGTFGNKIFQDVENNGTLQLGNGTVQTKKNSTPLTIYGTGVTQIVGKTGSLANICQNIEILKKGVFSVNPARLQGNTVNLGTLNLIGRAPDNDADKILAEQDSTLAIENSLERDFAIQNQNKMNISDGVIVTSDIDNLGTLSIKDTKITGNASDDKYMIQNYKKMTLNSKSGVNEVTEVDGVAIFNSVLIEDGKKYIGNLTISGNTNFHNNENLSNDEYENFGGVIINSGTEDYYSKLVLNGNYNASTGVCSAIFQNNKVDLGGAIANIYGEITSKQYVFKENSATNGGTLYNQDAKLTDTKSCFMGNNATQSGGAIYNNENSVINTKSTIFTSNTADNGGAIFNFSILNDNASNYVSNNAKLGGAIYNSDSVVLKKTKMTQNTAQKGGAVYNDAKLTINKIRIFINS